MSWVIMASVTLATMTTIVGMTATSGLSVPMIATSSLTAPTPLGAAIRLIAPGGRVVTMTLATPISVVGRVSGDGNSGKCGP
jgi:hypothetical protein